MDADALIDEYLRALMTEAQRLPGAQAVELVSDVRDHLNTALAEAGASDEATVRNILERLGTPEAIVGASLPESEVVAAAPAAPDTSMGNTEIAAVLLMTVGSVVIPVFAPLAGIYFARTSTKWTAQTKKRATWLGALSAAWAPLLTVLFLLAVTQRPLIQSVVNLLPGVQYETGAVPGNVTPNAGCNVLQQGDMAQATGRSREEAFGVLASQLGVLALPGNEIPGEWTGQFLGGLVAGVAADDDWRALQRTSDGMFVGVAHATFSGDANTVTPGGTYTATVVGDCGTLSFP